VCVYVYEQYANIIFNIIVIFKYEE